MKDKLMNSVRVFGTITFVMWLGCLIYGGNKEGAFMLFIISAGFAAIFTVPYTLVSVLIHAVRRGQ